ncbi:hypothetical protein DUI87_00035 [Hirundo rustica rustica]|uniref:Uncharacterized protein n=1 Tax=Hirundo rustica rustica TaxID=333673 RepID=A0A3M0LC26_HIRRU|nr:hypothetical protein DUI87_00035 [Hirundo rustica rustica]
MSLCPLPTQELVELGTGSDLGRGLSLARDSHGLYVAEAPKSLRLRQDRPDARGLQEAARSAGPARRRPGVGGAGPSQAPEAAQAPRSSRRSPEPPRPRITVREAAAARAPLPEPPEPPEPPRAPGEPPAGSGPRIPAVEVAAPKGSLGLSPPQIRPGKGGPAATPGAGGDEEGAARGGFAALRVPSVPIDVPSAAVELAPELGAAGPEPPGASPDAGSRFAEGLRKLSRELEAPAVEIAPKPPKFRLPRLGRALAKLREGGATPPASPPGIAIPGVELDLGAVGDAGAKLKVPKVSLAPFGDTEDGPRFGTGGSGPLRAPPGSAPRASASERRRCPNSGAPAPISAPGGSPKRPRNGAAAPRA